VRYINNELDDKSFKTQIIKNYNSIEKSKYHLGILTMYNQTLIELTAKFNNEYPAIYRSDVHVNNKIDYIADYVRNVIRLKNFAIEQLHTIDTIFGGAYVRISDAFMGFRIMNTPVTEKTFVREMERLGRIAYDYKEEIPQFDMGVLRSKDFWKPPP